MGPRCLALVRRNDPRAPCWGDENKMLRTGMRTGFGTLALAASLALAGLGGAAAAQTGNARDVATGIPVANESVTVDTGTNASAPPLADMVAPGAPERVAAGVTPPAPKMGQPTNGLMSIQPQVTTNGLRAHWFHDRVLFPLITVICLFVLALLVWVVIRYRQAANPVPSRTSHNTAIEVVWTLAPVLILVAIAVPSIGLLSAQFKPAPSDAVTLKAIGNQWYWSYQYPDHGGIEITANMLKERGQAAPGERTRTDADGPRLLAADNRIVLPVGVPIRLITTSNDVIHSWGVPAFWIKLDAIPGRLNETSFTIDKPGVYFGQCYELCGARHAFMPIAVEAVTPAQFAAWIRAKGGSMPTPGAASDAVIPQPGADNSVGMMDDAGTANTMTGPVQNGTATPTASPQGATGNPGGVGEAGL